MVSSKIKCEVTPICRLTNGLRQQWLYNWVNQRAYQTCSARQMCIFVRSKMAQTSRLFYYSSRLVSCRSIVYGLYGFVGVNCDLPNTLQCDPRTMGHQTNFINSQNFSTIYSIEPNTGWHWCIVTSKMSSIPF